MISCPSIVAITAVILLSVLCPITIGASDLISECSADKKVPYRIEVSGDGKIKLECRYVDCVNGSREEPECDNSYHTRKCPQKSQWLHGVKQRGNSLQAKCCYYQRLELGRYHGSIVVGRNQAFLGGFAYNKTTARTSQRDGFDVISNITKEGTGYRIWVYTMRCIPPSPERVTQQRFNDYADTRLGSGNPTVDYVQVQTRDANGNAQTIPVFYGYGSGGGGCFTGDTKVESRTRGVIDIRDLQMDEEVLTVQGIVADYKPVTFFLHRDPNMPMRFLTLHTDTASVTMTPLHLIFSHSCDQDPHSVIYLQKYAQEVEVGDCLMLINPHTQRLQRTRVIHISESNQTGVYSPITSNGVIVTNNIVSSCYSILKDGDIQFTIFNYMKRIETFMQNILFRPAGWLFGSESLPTIDVPRGLYFMLNILDNILPVSKLM